MARQQGILKFKEEHRKFLDVQNKDGFQGREKKRYPTGLLPLLVLWVGMCVRITNKHISDLFANEDVRGHTMRGGLLVSPPSSAANTSKGVGVVFSKSSIGNSESQYSIGL